MLSRFARRSVHTASRQFAVMQQGQYVTAEDMKASKNNFVKFVNRATLDQKSPEKVEMYNYLVQCFADNDTDYDGQVSFRGFNSMIAEAASAPRRFGFAPHTREMYETKEEYEKERQELFNKLRGTNERITMESWLGWANAHLVEKVGGGLQEHEKSKWERSKQDYIDFVKGVMKDKSSKNPKSSTSTQMKEHYLNSVRQFSQADVNHTGKLDAKQFEELKKICAALPKKHGMDLYMDWKMSDLTKQNYVTMKEFMDYKVKYLKEKVANKM